MASPKISLIVPIFNVEKYITQCIGSILDQDTPDLEVIFINDASTDESLRIVSKYVNYFINAKLINIKKNEGLGPARNRGIEIASGDYLMMLDSDDWLESNAIETLIGELCKSHNFRRKIDVFQYGCNKYYENNQLKEPDRKESNLYIADVVDNTNKLECQIAMLDLPNYAWLKLIRTEFIKKHKLRFKNIYYEDIPWSTSIAFLANHISFIPYSLVNYRQRRGSILNSKSKRHLGLLVAYDIAFIDSNRVTPQNRMLTKALNRSFIQASYYLYRQRNVRLGGEHTKALCDLYGKISRDNSVTPNNLRTFTMYCILQLNYLKTILTNLLSFNSS